MHITKAKTNLGFSWPILRQTGSAHDGLIFQRTEPGTFGEAFFSGSAAPGHAIRVSHNDGHGPSRAEAPLSIEKLREKRVSVSDRYIGQAPPGEHVRRSPRFSEHWHIIGVRRLCFWELRPRKTGPELWELNLK